MDIQYFTGEPEEDDHSKASADVGHICRCFFVIKRCIFFAWTDCMMIMEADETDGVPSESFRIKKRRRE